MTDRYQFGAYKLDEQQRTLTAGEEVVHLQPKAFDVLLYLLQNAGDLAGKQEIMDAVWRSTIVTENSLTRCIRQIRSVLNDNPEAPTYIETITGSGYRFIAEVSQANIHAREAAALPEVDSTTEADKRSDFKWISAALVTVLVLAMTLVFTLLPRDEGAGDAEPVLRTPEAPGNSIAVLPFLDLSEAKNQEYMSDGIAEEMLNLLSRIPELRVIARTSAFSFKGKDDSITEIGRKLNVAYILEGSVRRAGSKIRITMQLIDVSSESHVWSETYTRELDDIFAIQDEVAAQVTNKLKLTLSGELPKAEEVNREAHDALLRGRFMLAQRMPDTVKAAAAEFTKALEIDPDYALAHAELAVATLLLRRVAYGQLPKNEAIATAASHTERALTLDPDLAEAHAATGLLLALQDRNKEALTYYMQAIAINPNYSYVYNDIGNIAIVDGDYAESNAYYEKAFRLDPLSLPATENHVEILIESNRLDEADRILEPLATISPAFHAGLNGYRMSLDGNWANAIIGFLDKMLIAPDQKGVRFNLGHLFILIGLEEEALALNGGNISFPPFLQLLGRNQEVVAKLEMQYAENPDSLQIREFLAQSLAIAGDFDQALPLQEEVWQRSGRRVSRYGFDRSQTAALIAMRRDAGEDTADLIAALRDDVRRYREAGMNRTTWRVSTDFYDGLIKFLAGNHNEGLELMNKAVKDGYLFSLAVAPTAFMNKLFEHPGFVSIRAIQEARRVRERAKILDIVCKDNSYASVWQPVEETCHDYLP
jgi:adenylate cyclase